LWSTILTWNIPLENFHNLFSSRLFLLQYHFKSIGFKSSISFYFSFFPLDIYPRRGVQRIWKNEWFAVNFFAKSQPHFFFQEKQQNEVARKDPILSGKLCSVWCQLYEILPDETNFLSIFERVDMKVSELSSSLLKNLEFFRNEKDLLFPKFVWNYHI